MFASQLSSINKKQPLPNIKDIKKSDNRFIVDRINKGVYTQQQAIKPDAYLDNRNPSRTRQAQKKPETANGLT